MPKFSNAGVREIVFSLLSFYLLSPINGSGTETFGTKHFDLVNAEADAFVVAGKDSKKVPEPNEERTLQQQDVTPYTIWDASRFPEVMKEWEEKYPDLIRVTTAQEAYGLPVAGTKADCPFYKKRGCLNYFFTIQDFISHPEDSKSSSHLPEVFWSGAVHGNERVGPTSVMEAAGLLLESAYCEGLPRRSSSSLDLDLKEAKECRKVLHNKGIDDVHRKWLARLVSTRRIVVAPTANGKSVRSVRIVLHSFQ